MTKQSPKLDQAQNEKTIKKKGGAGGKIYSTCVCVFLGVYEKSVWLYGTRVREQSY